MIMISRYCFPFPVLLVWLLKLFVGLWFALVLCTGEGPRQEAGQDAAGDHRPGHQPQLQTELSSDKDGGREPSKLAKSKRYVMANPWNLDI